MLSIKKLLPNEEKFHHLIRALDEQAFTSAKLLKAYVDGADKVEREKAFKAISASKSVAKRISNDITRELCMTFVTPFDREDIQDFATNLYKIPKTIEKVAEYLDLYAMEDIADLSQQVHVILEEAETMQILVQMLIKGEKLKQVMEKAELLHALEDKGDKILRSLLVALIRDTTDARQLILKKDLYDLLEKIIDRYRDAASIALKIVLKNS